MTILFLVNKILSLATIASQIFIFLAIVYLLFFRKKYPAILSYFSKKALWFSFIVALIATGGSLFYSIGAGFTPCELCWFQRIFMYPEVILLGIALYKKDNNIVVYSLTLAFIGLFISLYQNYITYTAIKQTFCSALSPDSCTTPYVLEFGYVMIPTMAATAFLLIIISLISKKY
jgi:disulfide bond formation protein DsbB